MEELSGGRETAIYRIKNKVMRPAGKWSPAVHVLLNYLDRVGFTAAPKPFGFDEQGHEILSFVGGDTFNYPLSGNIASLEALTSAAQLLRDYHIAAGKLVTQVKVETMSWMQPAREPVEVVCHGDFAPYNVALEGKKVVGVFDFDTAHPGPKIWDVAYAVYTWAPFKTHSDDALGDLASQTRRAKLFCDAYGVPNEVRCQLVQVMIKRLQALVNFMKEEASMGNQAFIDNIANGHHLAYLSDIQYLENNEASISKALTVE
ncbi:aminoglycoside phosphotransferase family protein [Vibrio sp. 10N]|uniref:aminoglycoside phosphotransferase family protein n=1 Tax=Vibrio sp. 10N TaxID=3058938 RepID=UPI002812D73B|nr:aminoglycoside phosphotransferase family protein [Vibrio sp. 10N]